MTPHRDGTYLTAHAHSRCYVTGIRLLGILSPEVFTGDVIGKLFLTIEYYVVKMWYFILKLAASQIAEGIEQHVRDNFLQL